MSEYQVIPLANMLETSINTMEITMNEWEIAFIIGGAVAAAMLAACVLSWAGQRAWAWMDDKAETGENWFYSKFKRKGRLGRSYIYPMYNMFSKNHGFKLSDEEVSCVKPFSYARDENLNNFSVHGVDRSQYVYGFQLDNEDFIVFTLSVVFAVFAPALAVALLKIYTATLAALTLLAVAHLARFARRNQKLFLEYVVDKGAHKEEPIK